MGVIASFVVIFGTLSLPTSTDDVTRVRVCDAMAVTSSNQSCPVPGEYRAASRDHDGCVRRLSVGCQHDTYLDIHHSDCTAAPGIARLAVPLAACRYIHTYLDIHHSDCTAAPGIARLAVPLAACRYIHTYLDIHHSDCTATPGIARLAVPLAACLLEPLQ